MSTKGICNRAVEPNAALSKKIVFLTMKSFKVLVRNSQIFRWESKIMYS